MRDNFTAPFIIIISHDLSRQYGKATKKEMNENFFVVLVSLPAGLAPLKLCEGEQTG